MSKPVPLGQFDFYVYSSTISITYESSLASPVLPIRPHVAADTYVFIFRQLITANIK
jgi:hypothetical protein